MATFLELVNDLERESGTVQQAQRLGSVIGAYGRQEKIVAWIVEAWRMVQVSRTDWPWLRRDFERQLVIGQRTYTPAELGITDFAGWVLPDGEGYDPFTTWDGDLGRQGEHQLRRIGFSEYKARWARGVHDRNAPLQYAIDHDRKLCIGPMPDKAHWITGEYRRAPQVLALNADVPIMPAEHHRVILWRALMLLGDHDESPSTIAAAQSKYAQGFRALVDATLPAITL